MSKYFSLLFLFSASFLYSQQFSKKLPGNVSVEDQLKSPTTASFTNYSNENLVDLYTGMVDINIPIYQVSSKDIKVPITLKYRKDGIKVEEISGRTGLGWNMIAGGYIKREVKGNPDEAIMGISPSTGVEYFQNMGRFVDLTDFTYANNSTNIINEIPIGNDNGDKYIDYYLDLIKNDSELIDCISTYREIDFSFLNGASQSDFCKSYLVDAIKNDPNYLDYISSTGEIKYFWNPYRDTEPDIFHYSTPTESGSFILDSDGIPKIISGSIDVNIVPGIGPNADPSGWKITSANGIIHSFPNNSDYTEINVLSTIDAAYSLGIFSPQQNDLTLNNFLAYPDYFSTNVDDPIYRNERKVTSTWFLSSIASTKTDSAVNFTYQSQGDIQIFDIEGNSMDYVRTKTKTYSSLPSDLNNEPSYSINYTETAPNLNNYTFMKFAVENQKTYFSVLQEIRNLKYLSNITFEGGEIEFKNQDNYRLDLPLNYALDGLIIKDNNSKIIKEFKFDYDYFIELPYVNTNESSRLKLKSFREINNEDNNDRKYTFEYYEHLKLPSQDSKRQDYWGFFNNNNSNSLIPEGHRYFKDFSGADRSSNENKMKVWMLSKINYPTGGYNEISYEMNVHKSNYDGIERPIGGLRVFQTKTHDGISSTNNIIKNYTYQNGRSPNLIDVNWWRYFQSDSRFFDMPGSQQQLVDFHYIKRSESLLYPLLKTKGGWVGYERVTVSQNNNGRSEFRFTNPESHPDEEGNKIKFPYRSQSGSDLYHENDHINKDALRGLLVSREVFDENNKKLYSELNEYEDNNNITDNFIFNSASIEPEYTSHAIGFHPEIFYITNYETIFRKHTLIDFTEIRAYLPYLSKKTIRQYDMDDNIYNQTVYDYKRESTSHMQITEALTNTSKDEEVKIKYYYPSDNYPEQFLSTSEVNSKSLLLNHNRKEPIMIEEFLNSTLIKKDLNTFKTENNRALLKSYKTSKSNNSGFNEEVLYKEYDNSGNLVEFSKSDGTSTVYIWGYNKTLPIAKIDGASYNEVTSYISNLQVLSNNDNDTCVDASCSEQNLRNALNNLRLQLSDHFVSTYTYDPLVGMTSMTDSNGITTYYQYDGLNRLKVVKDQSGYTISENKYNYKTQN